MGVDRKGENDRSRDRSKGVDRCARSRRPVGDAPTIGARAMARERDGDARARAQRTTACHDAARGGDLGALAAALAEDSECVRAIDAHRRTPLHLAAHANETAAIEFLVRHGARVSAEAMDGRTALHFACAKGNAEAARALVRLGANAKGMTYKSENALHLACGSENVSVGLVSFLLRKRVSARAVSKRGRTPADCLRDDAPIEVREAL